MPPLPRATAITTPSPDQSAPAEPAADRPVGAADVLIVGAGPAGAALALQLAGRGLAVTVVEASHRFELSFRGQGLMPSGLEALAELGLAAGPVAGEQAATTWPADVPRRPLRVWSFVINGRSLFTVSEPMGSPVPCTLIEPGALLRHWRQQLVARGVRLLVGQAVVGLLEASGRVEGVALADGRAVVFVPGAPG